MGDTGSAKLILYLGGKGIRLHNPLIKDCFCAVGLYFFILS